MTKKATKNEIAPGATDRQMNPQEREFVDSHLERKANIKKTHKFNLKSADRELCEFQQEVDIQLGQAYYQMTLILPILDFKKLQILTDLFDEGIGTYVSKVVKMDIENLMHDYSILGETLAERINEEVKGWTFKSPAGRKQLKELEEKLGPKEFEKLSYVLKGD